MLRNGWDTRSTALVALTAAASGSAAALRDQRSGRYGALAFTLLTTAGTAALAVRRSANAVRNPPKRNELPPTAVSSAVAADSLRFRNPTAFENGDASARIPEGFANADIDSTDGTFDRRIESAAAITVGRASATGVRQPADDVVLAFAATSADSLEAAVWLVPSARYHVHELGPLSSELKAAAVPSAFVCLAAPGAGLRNEISKWSSDFHVISDTDLVRQARPRAIVMMSDWGPHSDLIAVAQAAGVPTFAKVEGAQDFQNRDTLRRVLPYTAADVVMCQGEYDKRHIGTRGAVVGSCRLENLLALRALDLAEPRQPGHVVANYNFSYGTREYAATSWLASVGKASSRANHDLFVSVHPAVSPPPGFVSCQYPLAFELERAQAFVTRASTALFDAAALGTPVAYFNPHREKCWRDLEFNDAVPLLRTERELVRWLTTERASTGAEEWLRHSFLSVGSVPSEKRMADLVLRET